jgi:hypothetical protein
MLRNTQIDKRWKDDNMGIKGDKIEVWGCFLTAIANLVNMLPSQLNEICIDQAVYAGKDSYGTESNIIVSRLCKILKLEYQYITRNIAEQSNPHDCILKLQTHSAQMPFHFVNLLLMSNEYYTYFDTYDGKKKTCNEKDVVYILKITKIKEEIK